MAQFQCLIQEGQEAERQTDRLEAGLIAIGQEMLGDQEPATVSWSTVAPGYMFTDSQPSKSSLIIRTGGRSTTKEEREAFMRRICDLWVETTGCTDHQVMITTIPSSPDQ